MRDFARVCGFEKIQAKYCGPNLRTYETLWFQAKDIYYIGRGVDEFVDLSIYLYNR